MEVGWRYGGRVEGLSHEYWPVDHLRIQDLPQTNTSYNQDF